MKPTILATIAWLLIVCVLPAASQTFDLQFVEVLNNGVNYDAKVQMKSNGGTFGMGSGNLVFTYTGGVSSPSLLVAHNFSGGFYTPMTVTEPVPGRVSVNIEYNGGTGGGTSVPSTYLDVVTIRFTTTNPQGTATFTWRTITPNRTNVFLDDNATEIASGTLNNLTTGTLPVEEETAVPHEFRVMQNYPNPFNPRTTIEFTVAQKELVSITLYDVIGREVMDLFHAEALPGRTYGVEVDGSALASGMYFYRVVSGQSVAVKRMVLLK